MNKINKLVVLFLSLLAFMACDEKEEHLLISPDEIKTEVVLSSDNVVLDVENIIDNAFSVEIGKANIGINVVAEYKVELSLGENKKTLSVTGSDLTKTFSSDELNTLLVGLGATPEVATEVKVRAVIMLGNVTVYSKEKMFSVTTYSTTFPPIYMTGEAVGAWDWNSDKIVPSSKPNVYSTLAHFEKGKAFRLFKQRDWGPTSYNYPYFSEVTDLLENANDGDKNFKVVGETGWYRITVDMKNKTVTMKTVKEPLMFMTGAALGGWDWTDNFVKMNFIQEGIWTATTEFAKGETFRFFAQEGWGDSYNYPYFEKVSDAFVNAEDGDKNFRFVKESGTYTITLNLNDKEVSLQ